MSGKAVLKLRDLVKTYPGVRAIDGVSFDVWEGEIHALIGENGAGKSTLIKTLSGAITPEGGGITIFGKTYNAMTPQLAKDLGIEVIYQEFNLVPGISAAENVFLGEKTGNKGAFVNIKERERKARELFEQLHVDIDPARPVRELSPAYQQIVEIAKAISRNVKILIMDEPTAPLTVGEVDMLFQIVRDLRARGVTIIYISHRLEELFEIADRVTVLRDGKYVDTRPMEEMDRKTLIGMMAGRELTETYPSRGAKPGKTVLEVKNLTGNGVRDISFDLREGEILGFAGLVGAGRTELMRVLYGVEKMDAGSVLLNGRQVRLKSAHDAIQNGIGLIPEDRKGQGAFLTMSYKWNTVINNLRGISRAGFVDTKKENEIAEQYRELFHIKTPSLEQIVGNFSGGNQQKVVIAKTLAADSKIVIFDEPTRGIDVGAKQEIYKLMNQLAESGHAIIVVSSEMPELLGMSDRIIVIAEGRVAGVVQKEQFDQNYILDLASGGSEKGA